jgi:mono/diheme cytochrome c family protein
MASWKERREMREMKSVLLGCLGVMVLAGLALAEASQGNREAGAKIYQSNCATCHGAQGQGDGPLARNLVPPPSNLAGKATEAKNTEKWEAIIRDGKPGTAMPPWKGSLSPQQIQDVLAYIKTLGG